MERSKTEKLEKSDRNPGQKALLIAQELELIRMLAGNEPKTKPKALKTLSKWLLKRSPTTPFIEEDFQRIWKGLYYCMWMSDKPLVQEECADKISKLVHFPDVSKALLFFKAGLYILSQEWNGIQQLRLDKFLMLVRRFLRETLIVIRNNKYSESSIQGFNDVLSQTVLNKSNNTPLGLFMHFVEIFMEELAKVSNGKLKPNEVLEFLRPFILCLATVTAPIQIRHLRKFIFTYLIRQSKLGMEYQEKYEAWRQQGFPGSIDSMQKVKIDKNDVDNEDSDEEIISKTSERGKERPLDPRAGRVDVEIPQLRFKAREIARVLLEHRFHSGSSSQSRAMIKKLAEEFTSLAKGVYPLGIKKIEVKDKYEDINIRKAANRLIKFDQKILGKKSKKRKHDKENNDEREMKRQKIENNDVIEKKHQKIENNDVIDKKRQKIENNDVIEKKRQKIKSNVEASGSNKKKLIKKGKELKISISKVAKEKNKDKLIQNGEGTFDVQTKTLSLFNENIGKKKSKSLKINKNQEESTSKQSKQNKTKSLTSVDDIKIKSNITKAKTKVKNKQLQIQLKRKDKIKKDGNENIECILERNSGTWIVYAPEDTVKALDQPSSKPNGGLSPAKSSKKDGKSKFLESNFSGQEASPNQSSGSKFLGSDEILKDSPNLAGMVPVKLFESSPQQKEIFPKFAWDEPLQEGEYEICIPSKKNIKKMKKEAKNQNKTVHELINTTLEKIKGKSRLSLDSRLVRDPFMKSGSSKKVKINTKLNKSQEVHEHYSRIKLSPGIPFDANRRPSKPLLKPTAVSTPINPFYKKQLNF